MAQVVAETNRLKIVGPNCFIEPQQIQRWAVFGKCFYLFKWKYQNTHLVYVFAFFSYLCRMNNLLEYNESFFQVVCLIPASRLHQERPLWWRAAYSPWDWPHRSPSERKHWRNDINMYVHTTQYENNTMTHSNTKKAERQGRNTAQIRSGNRNRQCWK